MTSRLLALAVAALLAWGPAQAPPLLVSAAISLADALEEVGKAYTAGGGSEVRLNLAGSNVLARQIVNGAPTDVFISADEAQMEVVQRAGALVADSRVDLLRNQLAVVAAPDRAAFVRDQFARAPAEIRRLALGDPAAVPAGVYAKAYLESQGLWTAYASRVVPTANVRAALVAVESGGADAAIVYVTDLVAARQATIAFVVPADRGPRIVYPAAIVAASKAPAEAARFLAFLRGPAASAIFARYKFTPIGLR